MPLMLYVDCMLMCWMYRKKGFFELVFVVCISVVCGVVLGVDLVSSIHHGGICKFC